VLALVTAAQYVRTGAARNVLVIGGDALSRITDWRDRGTCILFGDGCGAVLVSAAPDGAPCSLLGMDMHSDGSGQKALNAVYSGGGGKPARDGDGGSAHATYSNIAMAGQDVFKFAVRSVPAVLEAALNKAGLTPAEVDWLVLHQANQRILDAAAQRLGMPAERVVSNLSEYGNTSAASIPLALDEAVRGGRVKDGDVLALAGFGAGLTWAGAVVRWGAGGGK
jgi:3-oxoacyl-[acyl-carrier-protein] synthase-3